MFDPSAARDRLERLWKLEAQFGTERGTNRIFLDEMVSDRLQLVAGLQILRDELQFAPTPAKADREACRADLSLPSVVTTLAFTNCGDRIHQGEVDRYVQVVASRFATLSEIGTLKPEAFRPTGGGTDDGATLAHVTWAHVLDEPLRNRVYGGNAQSFVMCGFDLKAHIGRLDTDDGTVLFGKTQESPWREPRAACGAIVGAIAHYDEKNDVHRASRATSARRTSGSSPAPACAPRREATSPRWSRRPSSPCRACSTPHAPCSARWTSAASPTSPRASP